MELLLNLAWLLLALPAYWLWRAVREPAETLRYFVAMFARPRDACWFCCFPVISAPDDLHVMRAEMEDSAPSKRTVRQAASDKNSAWLNRMQSPPIMAASATRLALDEVGLLDVPVTCFSPLARPCVFHAGRAPPFLSSDKSAKILAIADGM